LTKSSGSSGIRGDYRNFLHVETHDRLFDQRDGSFWIARRNQSSFSSDEGGIGFTMSIFITNLAFAGEPDVINISKMAILLASLTAGTIGFLWLKLLGKPAKGDDDMDVMDFEVTHASN
jgi:hypothetical protein